MNRKGIALGSASFLALASHALAQPAVQTELAATAAVQGGNDRAAGTVAPAPSEIVVTAQRRAERVTQVPISITVANQAQLERQQITTINDLNQIAPSLEILGAPGMNIGGGGSIRGIGTQTFSQGAVASVGVVVDQVSQGNVNPSDLFDISRVEVLKGPQGTLFGLTTSAGVINITTNAPDPTRFSGRFHTDLSAAGVAGSEFGDQIVQGVVNMPLSPDAALRLSGFSNTRQGPDTNILDGHRNNVDRYGGRARLLWQPTDAITINLIGDYTYFSSDGNGDFFTFTQTNPATSAQLAQCGIAPHEGNQYYCTNQQISGNARNYGTSLQVDYDAGPVTLTSISAYRGGAQRGDSVSASIYRADPLSLQLHGGPVHDDIDLFTQEFRLSSPSAQRLEYTAGAFYSHQHSLDDPSTFNVDVYPFPGFDIPASRQLGARNDVLDDSIAAFGQATLHVTQQFNLIAGGRYTDERLSVNGYNYGDTASGSPPYGYEEKLSTDVVSYRFGAQYNITPRAMIYATVSRGYKGGQIAIPTNSTGEPYILQPEIPMDYEGGLKATLFGGWIADLNVFYEKIGNYQAQQCVNDPVTLALSCRPTNIDGVKTRGAELDLFGSPLPGLSVNTGFIYDKATYPGGFIGTDGSDIGGDQLAYAPKYKFTFSGEYEHAVSTALQGFAAVDAVWKSRISYELNSYSETTYRPHWIVGGRIGIRTAEDGWSLAVFARNLFNQHEPILLQSGSPDSANENIAAQYGPQSFRQVGLSLDGKF